MGVIYFFQNFYLHIQQKGDWYLPFVKLDGGAEACIQDFTSLYMFYTDNRYQQKLRNQNPPYVPTFFN